MTKEKQQGSRLQHMTYSPLNPSNPNTNLKTNNWRLPSSIFSMVMQSDVILGTLLNQ